MPGRGGVPLISTVIRQVASTRSDRCITISCACFRSFAVASTRRFASGVPSNHRNSAMPPRHLSIKARISPPPSTDITPLRRVNEGIPSTEQPLAGPCPLHRRKACAHWRHYHRSGPQSAGSSRPKAALQTFRKLTFTQNSPSAKGSPLECEVGRRSLHFQSSLPDARVQTGSLKRRQRAAPSRRPRYQRRARPCCYRDP